MDSGPAANDPNAASEQQPEAEVLVPQANEVAASEASAPVPLPIDPKSGKPQHKRLYRPSHRATFIGLTVVALILIINAVVIGVVIRSQGKDATSPTGQVTVSQSALDHLGVNRDTIGDSGVVLTITPRTQFKDSISVGGDLSIAGKFNLNQKLVATDASLTQLEAGNSTLNQLNVNGDSTVSGINVRNNLQVTGNTVLQGAVTLSQLLTVNNSVNVAGSLAVGSGISANAISGNNVTVLSTLTIAGHVVTVGSVPSLSGGSISLGSNGTISMSGNDAAGTIALNVGAGGTSAGGGIFANVTFKNAYQTTPHVVVTPIGNIATDFYVTRSKTGFSIGLSGPITTPGGYAFDYIVEQ